MRRPASRGSILKIHAARQAPPLKILGAVVLSKAGAARRSGRWQIRERIFGAVVVAHFEMQVRSARTSARADLPDLLAARDAVALVDEIAPVVSVYRFVGAAMLQDHDVAVAAKLSIVDDDAVIGREHRSARRRRDIHALVHRTVGSHSEG